MLELAKQHVDFGLYTNDREEMLAFWGDEAGLAYDHLLPAGGGVHQHRFGMNGSVMKVNHVRDPLEASSPAGYRLLRIARPGLAAARELCDPDGNRVRLEPPGRLEQGGVEGIGIELGVRDPGAFERFYGEALGLATVGEHAFRCGDSLLRFHRDPDAAPDAAMRAPGFRYITIQVKHVDEAHAAICARGGRSAREPVTLGETARISFVRDPDGNWIELSQRRSLTGSLDAKAPG